MAEFGSLTPPPPQSSVDWLRQYLPTPVGDYLSARETQAMQPTSPREVAGDVISTAMNIMPAGRMAAPRQGLRSPIFSIEDTGHGLQLVRPKQLIGPDSEHGLLMWPDKAKGIATVQDASLPENMRGQGIGTAMYEAANQWANNKGLRLVSDASVSTDAARVYEALARRGHEVERNPSAVLDKRGEHWVFPNVRPPLDQPQWIYSVKNSGHEFGSLIPPAQQ